MSRERPTAFGRGRLLAEFGYGRFRGLGLADFVVAGLHWRTNSEHNSVGGTLYFGMPSATQFEANSIDERGIPSR